MKSKHSFAGRLTRDIILVLLVPMLIISVIVFGLSVRAMGSQLYSHYQGVMRLTNERLERVLTNVEISAVNNVNEIEEALETGSDIYATMEHELRLNPHVIGCGIGFIPDYDPARGRWFEPYITWNEAGTIDRLQIGSEQHDYLQNEWYRHAVDNDEGFWCDPYFDEAGAKAMLCTYSLPVWGPDDRIVGAYGIDISLSWLSDRVREIEQTENNSDWVIDPDDPRYAAYCFVLGRNSEYIIHPDQSRILHDRFSDHAPAGGDPVYQSLGERMLSGETGSVQVVLEGIPSFVFFAPLVRAGWSMAVAVPKISVYFPGILLALLILLLISLGLLTVAFVCRAVVRRSTQPLKALSQSANAVARGDFETRLPDIRQDDEIRVLRDSFADMQVSLSDYIGQLTAATAQKASMESELSIARDIQMSMLPKVFPPFPDRRDIDVFAQLVPAKAVGGDLYDFFILENRLYFCIGDVSGKGVPASLVMAVTATRFRTLSNTEKRPDQIVSALNDAMSANNESMMFVTLFIGSLDLATGELLYCNAGHNAPAMMTPSGPARFLDVASNVAVGVTPGVKFQLQSLKLEPGSILFLYTDGLNEAEDPAQNQFGEQRILDELAATGADNPEMLVARMTGAVRAFAGEAEQSDDQTMLAVRFNGAE